MSPIQAGSRQISVVQIIGTSVGCGKAACSGCHTGSLDDEFITVYVCTIELLEDVRIQVGLDGGMGGMKAVPLDSAQLLRAAKHGVNIMRFAVDFPQQVLTIHVVGARHA